jgi:hypothetical protein
MGAKSVIRCASPMCSGNEKPNILLAFEGNSIFVKCRDWDCKRFTKITVNIPGIKIDFKDAGIIQEVLPADYHLSLEPACSVVGEHV